MNILERGAQTTHAGACGRALALGSGGGGGEAARLVEGGMDVRHPAANAVSGGPSSNTEGAGTAVMRLCQCCGPRRLANSAPPWQRSIPLGAAAGGDRRRRLPVRVQQVGRGFHGCGEGEAAGEDGGEEQ